ncbi:MAG: trypsin-like peptidase domain-containing protein [Bdellovibrio sp.]|nr:trypsin-like peptidase domain-containing protein [Bdellovibrio sp.]
MTELRVFGLSFLLLAFTAFGNAGAVDKVVYGDDDRLDIFETTNPLFLDIARSTAAMIERSSLSDAGENVVISGDTLEQRGICSTAKFAKQITAAMCSGFLVGKDLLVTAGHCVRTQADCDTYAWVFDYNLSSPDKAEFSVAKSSVYRCKKIVSQTLDRATQNDFALIRLERAVTDREPLNYRKEGKIETNHPIVVIGHPTGLPTKVAAGAAVRSNENGYYFVANLDTFGGNSGSAVFDALTGSVEGILVRGENDYVYDYQQGCRVPQQCTNDGCRGEDVTRITNIRALIQTALDEE